MLRVLAIALALSLAPAAQAASLPQLRAEVTAVDAKVASARAGRVELQRTLDEVARQIESLKARSQDPLFANGELDSLLKRSQDLSSRVTDALKAENEAEEGLRGSQSRLVSELDQELSRLRAKWDAAKAREERAGLLTELKALRAERDSLRRALPETMVPRVSDRPSDDPEELLERADALYDGEDKLRREERALARRIDELKAERDLERRMNEFIGEDALYDEHDRSIRAVRPALSKGGVGAYSDNGPSQGLSPTPTLVPGASSKTAGEGAPPAQSPTSYSGYPTATDSAHGGAMPPGSGMDPAKSSQGASGSATFGKSDGADTVTPATRVDVSKNPPERRAGIAAYSEDESLEELAARRAELKKLADQMHQKADDAAQKAKSLK